MRDKLGFRDRHSTGSKVYKVKELSYKILIIKV